MKKTFALMALALFVAACDQQGGAQDSQANAPQLDAPAPETEPSRVFAASNDAARAVAPNVTVAVTLRLPDNDNADSQEVLTINGANGLVLESVINGAISPATQVGGQTLRALFDIPVEEPQVLVYRVSSQTKGEGQGLCGATNPDFVVVWEPTGPGEPVMKLIGVTGGQPGATDSHPCPMLEYRRS